VSISVKSRPAKTWGPVDGRGHAMFGWRMEEEAKLEFTITVNWRREDGSIATTQLGTLDRGACRSVEDVGLQLADAKRILGRLQAEKPLGRGNPWLRPKWSRFAMIISVTSAFVTGAPLSECALTNSRRTAYSSKWSNTPRSRTRAQIRELLEFVRPQIRTRLSNHPSFL
jgi:hypothetical protein